MNKSITKAEAVQALADDLYRIHSELHKASFVISEVTEEYFRFFDPDNTKGKDQIALNFRRYAAFAEVVEYIIIRITGISDKLQAYSEGKVQV